MMGMGILALNSGELFAMGKISVIILPYVRRLAFYVKKRTGKQNVVSIIISEQRKAYFICVHHQVLFSCVHKLRKGVIYVTV